MNEPTRIHNKYDLMHLATPDFADAVITWDTSKLTKIVKNKVIRWLDTGIQTNRGGQAAAIYRKLRSMFGIPQVVISGNWVYWENVSPDLMTKLQELATASAVVYRMKWGHTPWWTRQQLEPSEGQFELSEGMDTADIEAGAKQLVEQNKHKALAAKEFVLSGQKIQFVY